MISWKDDVVSLADGVLIINIIGDQAPLEIPAHAAAMLAKMLWDEVSEVENGDSDFYHS